MQTTNYLKCSVGTQWYGIPVNYVIEVLQIVALDKLPGTTPHVLGLLTLRNQVMPVLDLRRIFNMPDVSLSLDTPLIAIQFESEYLAFAVDSVDDVISIDEAILQPVDDNPYVHHTANLGTQLLFILDIKTHISQIQK